MNRTHTAKPLFDLLVYDFDGTLVDTERDIVASVQRTLAACGLPAQSYDEIKPHIGRGGIMLIKDVLRGAPDHEAARVFDVFRTIYRQHAFDTARPFRGVKTWVPRFKTAGIRQAILSNKSNVMIGDAVRLFGMTGLFDRVIGAEDQKAMKPSPDALLDLLAATGTRPERCLVIGDMSFDMELAKNAGTKLCAALYGMGSAEMLMRYAPDFTIRRFSDLGTIVFPRA